jgi:pimeloyl-ACP methyl ester carboxylesterase
VPAFTTADGRRLSYRELGEGPPLICHPGGPGITALLFDDLGGLDRDRTLILLSPRGVDESDPAESYRLEDYAADLEELRRQLGLERIDLFGHSAGGFVSILYAAANPERVSRLVLCGSFARFSDEFAAAFTRYLAEREHDPRFAEAVAARRTRDETPDLSDEERGRLAMASVPLLFGRYGAAEAAFLERVIAAGGSYNVPALNEFNDEIAPTMDLRADLERIEAPTLVLTGDIDVWGAGGADELARHLPDARVRLLEGVGHMPWVEEPDGFRQAMLDFLG